MYNLKITREAGNDVNNLVAYMAYSLKNGQAAKHFLTEYHKRIQSLSIFPFGYRGVEIEYQGYEIRMNPFSSYNIFFVVNSENHEITILRILKNRQNWEFILHSNDEYSF